MVQILQWLIETEGLLGVRRINVILKKQRGKVATAHFINVKEIDRSLIDWSRINKTFRNGSYAFAIGPNYS